MKKIIIVSLSLLLAGSFAFAQNSEDAKQRGAEVEGIEIENSEVIDTVQVTGQGQEVQTQTVQQAKNQGEEQQIRIQENTQTMEGKTFILESLQNKARTMTEVREMIQQRSQEMDEELQDLSKSEQNVYKNQNTVRTAVHALLSVEDLVGGIGPKVSEVARGINNSILATVIAEEKIQKRNAFVKFFVGGDQEAVSELNQELDKNKVKIQELRQLREDCDCDEEVSEMLQEQIENIQQEQDRLQQVTKKEQSNKGVFGWFKNLFRWGK